MSLLLLFAGSSAVDLTDVEVQAYADHIKRRYEEKIREERGEREVEVVKELGAKPIREVRPGEEVTGRVDNDRDLLIFYSTLLSGLGKQLNDLVLMRNVLEEAEFWRDLERREREREYLVGEILKYERKIEEEEILTLLALLWD